MNPRKYIQGIVTHPNGHACKVHVMQVEGDTATTSFGTFRKGVDGVWRWLAGHDFTLTFEE